MKSAEIRYWMDRNGISQKKIVAATGKSKSLVSMTIKGERCNDAVIAFLRSSGCPDEYFAKCAQLGTKRGRASNR